MKQPGKSDLSEYGQLIAVGAAIGLGEAAGMSIRVGESLYADTQQHVSWNPLIMAINLGTGDLDWTGAATGGAITLTVGTGVAVAGSVWAWKATCRKCSQLWSDRKASAGKSRRRKADRHPVDAQARYMARGKELVDLGHAATAAKAQTLKVRLAADDAPGVLIGETIADGARLYGSYEDLHLDIWGPRQGKSTSRVIPAIMDAPGAVVATSNKRDVVDATRGPRARKGTVRVFDPQGIAGSVDPNFYWNPLDWVLADQFGAQERAAELAGHFADAGEADNRDAFFDPEGEDLLAGLFLAAALAKEPITKVFEWVTKVDDRRPIEILSGNGYPLLAGAMSDQYYAPDRQRGGVFSTAKKMASCLKYERIRPWVCAPTVGEAPREAFDAAEFVKSHDTLYPLSKEGKGTSSPLITAMCAAVAREAEIEGTFHGGRLPTPMLMVLDEAANIVRWRDLPKQYSHFGSRGVVVMTVLQSWAQGVRCWGLEGMQALLSAANVLVLGSGLRDSGFLRDMSELVGQHYELSTSVSRSAKNGEKSTSTSRITEITLHASDIAALPRGRALVFTSGHRPTLARCVPWMERDCAEEVRASIDTYDPAHSSPRGASPRLHVVRDDEEGISA
ncbi:type IV secretory system conjugative DNA transfer family protein [Nocardia aurea]|uniref:TraM recognition domain-containing protein n=1 Tax=Nocardia aurea TaxID=2144174 RepID=A0ABV3G4Y6_9NOCA